MRTRDAELLYQETQTSDASSKTIELDIVDPISALAFEFQAQGGTTNNQNNPLTMCVSKLEVVDGSDVLASLSFEQAQALEFYKTGKQPFIRIDEQASNYNVIGCLMLFGRYLWDQEFALDLKKFTNPKLKITWNLAAVRAVAADTAFATGTFKISVAAKIMEDLASVPANFLMQKELESWTGGSSGDKKCDLPLDFVYRMLMLRTYLAGNDIDENISRIKLSADTDKFIPLYRYVKPFDAEMAQLFGNCVIWKRAHATSNDSVWVPVNKEPQPQLQVTVPNVIPYYSYAWSGAFMLNLRNYSNAAVSADTRVDALVEGHALHSTLPIPMGDMKQPNSWLDPTPYKKLELICSEGAAAANSLVAEQVRPN